jgi:hypothetical protein
MEKLRGNGWSMWFWLGVRLGTGGCVGRNWPPTPPPMGGSSTLGTERRSELKQFPILPFNYLSTTIKNVNCASLSETPLTHTHTPSTKTKPKHLHQNKYNWSTLLLFHYDEIRQVPSQSIRTRKNKPDCTEWLLDSLLVFDKRRKRNIHSPIDRRQQTMRLLAATLSGRPLPFFQRVLSELIHRMALLTWKQF